MNPPPASWAADTPDDDLVDAAQRGDATALEVLLRRHHDRVLLLCRRLCRDRGDADDAAQNALIAIVRGLPQFDRGATFSTWSYRVATNACLDELRRRGRRPTPTDRLEGDGPTAGSGPRTAGGADPADPADAAVSADTRSRLQDALDELPDEFRLPVVLRDLADLDYAEIGEHLGIPPGTVRSRISRGRARLAARLELTDLAPGNRRATSDVTGEDP